MFPPIHFVNFVLQLVKMMRVRFEENAVVEPEKKIEESNQLFYGLRVLLIEKGIGHVQSNVVRNQLESKGRYYLKRKQLTKIQVL